MNLRCCVEAGVEVAGKGVDGGVVGVDAEPLHLPRHAHVPLERVGVPPPTPLGVTPAEQPEC